MQSHFGHQLIHDKSCTCHVAAVFEEAEEDEQECYLREECYYACDSCKCAVDNQAAEISRRHRIEDGCPAEDGLEDDGHHAEEQEESPYTVCDNPVDAIRQGAVGPPLHSQGRCAEIPDPCIAGFNEYRRGIYAEERQTLVSSAQVLPHPIIERVDPSGNSIRGNE